MYILKISAIKTIKISVTIIVKITDRNAGMQNVLNCQITSTRKMGAKLFNVFFKILTKTHKSNIMTREKKQLT